MENILEIGDRSFKVVSNFKKSYNLTKYRNKITTGFDFSEADKETVAEIIELSKNAEEGNIEMKDISPKALKLLANKNPDIFSYEEIIDIMKILTEISDVNEIEIILDKEVESNGYDSITNKLTTCISMVFTNAKDISNSKKEIIKVAKK